jgi:voltage-gated sodium channel
MTSSGATAAVAAAPVFGRCVRERALALVENHWFSRTVIGLIVVNAVVLGLETYPGVVAAYGTELRIVDRAALWIFVAELTIRLVARGLRFFRDPWSLFDTFVVAIAFVPANETFAVLRAVRVLRVLRLVSVLPSLRRVVEGLIGALPGIGSIGVIMAVIFYVFAVMATKLYGAAYPGWFGSLGASTFSLFQIMTLEGWADMVRDMSRTHAFAPAFFVVYILIATFTILNLFIAIIVDAMQREHRAESDAEREAIAAIRAELAEVHHKIDTLVRHSRAATP